MGRESHFVKILSIVKEQFQVGEENELVEWMALEWLGNHLESNKIGTILHTSYQNKFQIDQTEYCKKSTRRKHGAIYYFIRQMAFK